MENRELYGQEYATKLENERADRIARELKDAMGLLQKFGVIKLSNLEGIELRKSIESLFDEQVQYIKDGKPTEMFWNTSNPSEEAVARFLVGYGIIPHQIYKNDRGFLINQIVFDKTETEYLKIKLKQAREEAHKPFLDETE